LARKPRCGGTTIHFLFKDGNDLRVAYKKSTAKKTQSGEWTAKTECSIVESYPSDDHPADFHELFRPDGGEGWWAMLSPGDMENVFGGQSTIAPAAEVVSRGALDPQVRGYSCEGSLKARA